MIIFVGPLAPKVYLTLFNQINNPGDGQVGASISSPGYLKRGTTLIFKGPYGDKNPQIVLSQPPIKETQPGETIPVTITGVELPASTRAPGSLRARGSIRRRSEN